MVEEELQSIEVNSDGAEEQAEASVAEDERVQALEARLAQLEATVEGQRLVLAAREEEAQRRGQEAATLKEQLGLAVARYREMALAKALDVPAELVVGETVEEIDASLAAAQALVDRVRKQMEARAAAERVPTGAPARKPPDLSALSPREKIAYALSKE